MTISPDDSQFDIPSSWQRLLDLEPSGLIMIVGATDRGKTTLARFLHSRLAAQDRGGIAYLDGDPGQSSLGPPTTISLGLSDGDGGRFPPRGPAWHWFVGSTSPSGHMLPHLSGLARLTQVAREHGASTVIFDTCGLVEPRQGGHVLKNAEIDLLQPKHLLALQRESELEAFLKPRRGAATLSVHEVEVPRSARPRSAETRAENRARRYRQHFRPGHRHRLHLDDWPLFPPAAVEQGRLAGLCDADGFVLALAVVESERPDREITLMTPLEDLAAVALLRVGDVLLDLRTYRDRLKRLPDPRQR